MKNPFTDPNLFRDVAERYKQWNLFYKEPVERFTIFIEVVSTKEEAVLIAKEIHDTYEDTEIVRNINIGREGNEST